MNRIYLYLFLSALTLMLSAQNRQIGIASYYARSLHGRPTTSGALYNNDSLTCAHLHYPYGTILKVRNLSNSRSVLVKVTDRGPYAHSRIIDLSYAAAKKLHIITRGLARVEVTRVWPVNQVPYQKVDNVDICFTQTWSTHRETLYPSSEWNDINEDFQYDYTTIPIRLDWASSTLFEVLMEEDP